MPEPINRRPSWRRTGAAPLLAAVLASALALTVPPGAAGAGRDHVAAPAAGPVRSVGFQVGQPAPGFTVTTLDGLPLTSAELLAQEKPFILYFFATW